jgi:hypothetical protein
MSDWPIINAMTLGGGAVMVHMGPPPDECPVCHRSVHPKFVSAHVCDSLANDVQVVFQCTSSPCQAIFIGAYRPGSSGLELRRTDPWRPEKAEIPAVVATLSPMFVTIRNQVEAADAARLDQLVGMGLRKALEFLIKDFAISEHPKSKEEIKKIFLGVVIENYIGDPNLKACAARATWLGNDETHYVRKWETKDIQDLKALVELTVAWIQSHLLTKQYLAQMPKS